MHQSTSTTSTTEERPGAPATNPRLAEGSLHRKGMDLDNDTGRSSATTITGGMSGPEPKRPPRRTHGGRPSLLEVNPALAAEWDTGRNGDLTPADVTPGSNKKVWWNCDDGHHYQMRVHNRSRGRGCPYAAGQRVDESNSLAGKNPALAAEWDTERNGDLTPADVTPGSDKEVWWNCDGGHHYQMRVNDRSRGGLCPGCHPRWNREKLQGFVASLQSYQGTLKWAEIVSIMQIAALPHQARRFVALQLGLDPLRGDCYDPTSDPTNDPIDGWTDGVDGSDDDVDDPEDVDDPFVDEPDGPDIIDLIDGTWIDGTSAGDPPCGGDEQGGEPGTLPVITPGSVLASGEDLLGFDGMSDARIAEYLRKSRVAKLWTLAYRDPEGVDAATAEPILDSEYQEIARASFRSEFDAARNLVVPKGWTFRAAGATGITDPNLMQRHAAAMIQQHPYFGNWSGTGTGKTAAAVLAARLIGAGLRAPGIVLVVCPNNTIDGWKRTIESAFRDVFVETKTLAPSPNANGKQHWCLVNFEMLSQPNTAARLDALLQTHRIDFLVVDEVQFAKKRGALTTKRREALTTLRALAIQENPDMKVLGMSATPVINSLSEARSLLELLTGQKMDHLDVRGTVHNAVAIHRELVTLGIRCRATAFEMPKPRLIDVDANALIDDVLALGRTPTPLDYERTLLPAKLDLIVAECKRGGKSLIYTEFKDAIRPMLMDALTAAGLKVGQFDGDKKELDAFLGLDRSGGVERILDRKHHLDVLIGTKPIGTGIDGLQYHASRLIFATLPWTAADYQQIVGRIWRQGRPVEMGAVDVVIPVDRIVHERPDGSIQDWSYTATRWALVQAKRTLADAAVDGVKPDWVQQPDHAHVTKSIQAWLMRIMEDRIVASPPGQPISLPLDPAVATVANTRSAAAVTSEFSQVNFSALKGRACKSPGSSGPFGLTEVRSPEEHGPMV